MAAAEKEIATYEHFSRRPAVLQHNLDVIEISLKNRTISATVSGQQRCLHTETKSFPFRIKYSTTVPAEMMGSCAASLLNPDKENSGLVLIELFTLVRPLGKVVALEASSPLLYNVAHGTKPK